MGDNKDGYWKGKETKEKHDDVMEIELIQQG